jgi:hypothetical protein
MTIARGAAALVAVLGLLGAPGCHEETPEAAIRRVLADGVAAIHARDVDRAGRHLSPEYGDRAGRTATEIRQLAFFALKRGPVYVVLGDTSVEVELGGDRARVTTTAYAVQGRPEVKRPRDLLPQDAERLELTLRFAREDGRWRVRAIDGDGLMLPGLGG